MSFIDCINGRVKDGTLSSGRGRELNNRYNALVSKYTENMGSAQAASEAAAQIVKIQERVLLKEINNKMLHASYLQTVKADLDVRVEAIKADKQKAAQGTKWLYGTPYARAVREMIQKISHRQGAIRFIQAGRTSQSCSSLR